MDWNRQALSVLIQAYREERCLYDQHDPLYPNKHARREKLKVVGDKVRAILPYATDDDCKSRFTSLRSHYCGELKKIRDSERSGAGAEDIYKPTVWWFQEMTFLKNYAQPRKSVTNIPISVIPQSCATQLTAGMSTSNVDVPNDTEEVTVEEVTAIVESCADDNSNYSQEIFTVECGEDMARSTPQDPPQSVPQDPPQSPPYASSRKKRRRKDNVDELATSTLSLLHGIEEAVMSADEDDKFGQYVAAELKKMSSTAIKAEVKLNVMKAITHGIIQHHNN